jgi:hypothetical protein
MIKSFERFCKINEAENVPQNKKAYIFDFDDTLGVTNNPNGVTLFRDKQPAFKTSKDLQNWLISKGIKNKDYLRGPKGFALEKPEGRDYYVAYLTSGALARLQSQYQNQTLSPNVPQVEGDALYMDFTPSRYVDQKTTAPINNVINTLKTAKQSGADTMVVTARRTKGNLTDFSGKSLPPTNSRDMYNFLKSRGAQPSNKVGKPVQGVAGENKGDFIIKKFLDVPPEKRPEEIHFYDDMAKNNTQVINAFKDHKEPADLYVYGPGEFAKKEADPNHPKLKIPAKR